MRLLADFGEVVPVIIGIIALISWVANKIKESSNANAAGENQTTPLKQKLYELCEFVIYGKP